MKTKTPCTQGHKNVRGLIAEKKTIKNWKLTISQNGVTADGLYWTTRDCYVNLATAAENTTKSPENY